MSMDTSGKIIWAKHSEVQQANLKAMGDTEIKDGERLPLAVKDMGSCEIYPQTIQHNPNGRSVRTALDSRVSYSVNLSKCLAQQLHICVPHLQMLYKKNSFVRKHVDPHHTHTLKRVPHLQK